MRSRLIFVLLLPIISLCSQQSQLYTMEPLIITAGKIPTTLLGANRNILVIESDEIIKSPASGVADLLKYISGININERGPEGVQSDVSVRGGTFEQTLILVDGVKVNDSQTAHHDLNLPVQLEDIDRIEILKGPAARLYGAGAYAGVINIITRKEEPKKLKLKALIGNYQLLDGNFSLSQPLGLFYNILSVSGKRSDGYRHNTDFDIWNVFFNSVGNYGKLKGNISIGYNDKDFGASSFYSDIYPNQRENTETVFLRGSVDLGKNGIIFHVRRHRDDYILDYENPDFYRNYHTTYSYGSVLQSSLSTGAGFTAGGLEVSGDKIKSTNLGDYSRIKTRFFFEHSLPDIHKVGVVLGSSLLYYSDWDWQFSPGINIGYSFSKRTYLYASIERALRIPSYTELYLISPVNIGNRDLTPESALAFETGIRVARGSILTNINTFIRKQKNTIDWVRIDENEPWRATNTGEVTVKGLDVNITFKSIARMYKKIPIPVINFGYTFLNLNRDESSLQSKYLLGYPEHKFTLSADYDLTSNLKQVWKARYEILPDFEKYLIFDTSVSFEIKNSELFVDVTNLLNTEYTQAGWITMPGRWAKAGVRVKIY
jgi:vitamin B12 transporter